MFKFLSFVIISMATILVYETSQGKPHENAIKHDADVVAIEEEVVETEAMPTLTTQEQQAEMVVLPTISEFDTIMRKVGEEQGQDWRLMSAIAYNETRFREDLVSKRGAVGIMQIRPVVARHFNVPVEQLADTETNVRLAGMLLSELEGMLKLPATTPTVDRLSIILASYNAGIGRIHDACRLARSEGANPNSWADVSRYLELMADPAYYTRETVHHGKFNGSRQTLGYVREVMKKYNEYCNLAS
jgi:membrane-bound lytic murein transglycosylase F